MDDAKSTGDSITCTVDKLKVYLNSNDTEKLNVYAIDFILYNNRFYINQLWERQSRIGTDINDQTNNSKKKVVLMNH